MGGKEIWMCGGGVWVVVMVVGVNVVCWAVDRLILAGFTKANTVYRATSTGIPEYEPSVVVTMEQKGGPYSRADRKLAINIKKYINKETDLLYQVFLFFFILYNAFS